LPESVSDSPSRVKPERVAFCHSAVLGAEAIAGDGGLSDLWVITS